MLTIFASAALGVANGTLPGLTRLLHGKGRTGRAKEANEQVDGAHETYDERGRLETCYDYKMVCSFSPAAHRHYDDGAATHHNQDEEDQGSDRCWPGDSPSLGEIKQPRRTLAFDYALNPN
jgi:hypothetical protein